MTFQEYGMKSTNDDVSVCLYLKYYSHPLILSCKLDDSQGALSTSLTTFKKRENKRDTQFTLKSSVFVNDGIEPTDADLCKDFLRSKTGWMDCNSLVCVQVKPALWTSYHFSRQTSLDPTVTHGELTHSTSPSLAPSPQRRGCRWVWSTSTPTVGKMSGWTWQSALGCPLALMLKRTSGARHVCTECPLRGSLATCDNKWRQSADYKTVSTFRASVQIVCHYHSIS